MRYRSLLFAILTVAAVLRFAGLSWGLRHRPSWDERVFVHSTRAMITNGDLDHRYYEYPGLFFYLLYPVLASVPSESETGAFYLAARALVAAFGVASVALTYLLGARLAGPGVGLLAAAFVAVSPVHVQTAHQVRPDVVLGTFALIALSAFVRLGPDPRRDVWAGATLGAATAIKFTGVFLLPSLVVARLLAPGFRPSRLVWIGFVSLAVFFILTPYSLLNYRQYLEGVEDQIVHHYAAKSHGDPSYLEMVWTYVGHPRGSLRKALGTLGVLLLIAGVVSRSREWRVWLPLIVYPTVVVAVMSTAVFHHDRHLVPPLGVLALFAALGLQSVARYDVRPAALLGVVALGLPLFTSATYAIHTARPGTRDRAVDWIEAHLDEGSGVLTMIDGIGIDKRQYEVLGRTLSADSDRLLSLHMDAVIARLPRDKELLSDLEPVLLAEPDHPAAGPPIGVYTVPQRIRPRYVPVPLESSWLSASVSEKRVERMVDGRSATGWKSASPQRADTWIEVRLPSPVPLAKIELALGRHPLRYGEGLRLYVTSNGEDWERTRIVRGRPEPRRQVVVEEEASQVLILQPALVSGIRLVTSKERSKPWFVAELRLFALTDGESIAQ